MFLTDMCEKCEYWKDDDGTDISFGCLSHFGCQYINDILDKSTEKTIKNKKEPYIFSGSVYYFDTYLKDVKNITTYATSKREAINNLTFRIKKELGYSNNSKILLRGTLKKGYE